MAKKEPAAKKVDFNTTIAKYLESKDIEYFKTGSVILDAILSNGLGLPKHKILELYSPSGLGKTTTCLTWAKYLWETYKKRTLYLDAEKGGVSESLLMAMNIPAEAIIHLTPDFYTDIEDIFESFVAGDVDDIGLVVFDSVTALMPSKVMKTSIEAVEPGLKARHDANLMMKLRIWIKMKSWSIVLINQTRTKIAFFGPCVEDSAAANAIRFFSDIRVGMKEVEKIEEGGNQIGKVLEVAAVKNRWARPYNAYVMHILFGKGISNTWAVINKMTEEGLLLQNNHIFTCNVEGLEKKCVGKAQLYEHFSTNLSKFTEYMTLKNLTFVQS